MRLSFSIIFILGLCLALWNRCGNSKASSIYKNIDNPKATYVGMDKCRNCHEPIYQTYIKTGMGQSWDLATKSKSAATFDAKAWVHDSIYDLWYHPHWVGDSLHITEYKWLGKDTIHKRDETIQYIVGSGQHTNSHIYSVNGFLHQAPITFYTQKGKWDMAPGFEDENTRFDRKIETECITCHNGYPQHVAGSFNKYESVKRGIDCERCHGPGSLHVEGILAGEIKDTSKEVDYRIVNPRRMTIEQQNNLCQRCHLQGISVLNEDADFFDFQPSQTLSDYWNVFMPEFKNKKNHMIMASHVERMKMSECFIKSEKMSCITCHNPHVSVKYTATEVYNNACKNCHTQNNNCSASASVRQSNGDNCNACHMAKNNSIDIPHVAVHDHYIRKNINEKDPELQDAFLGLKSYNNKNIDATTMGRGFLEFYERYQSNQAKLLDSALHYLTLGDQQKQVQHKDIIRYYFLKQDYQNAIALGSKTEPQKIKDHWNAYRIGEAYLKLENIEAAVPYLQRAVDLMPLHLDYKCKLANSYLLLKDLSTSKKIYTDVIQENPKTAEAQSHLGYIFMQEKNNPKAIEHLSKAIQLNSNNTQAMINLAVIYYQDNNKLPIKNLLRNALLIEPNNEQLKAMMADLGK